METRSHSRALLNPSYMEEYEDEYEEKDVDITDLTNDFFGNRCSAHAVPHAANTSHSHCRRIIWAVLSLILLFVVLVLISHLLKEYFKYPKQVTIEIEELDDVIFPSVTVCNFNIVKLSEVKNSRFASLVELEERSGREDCENYESTAPWVVDKDYEAFTAKQYWSVNNLNSDEIANFVVPYNITTSTSTTTSTTTSSTSTTSSSTSTSTTYDPPTECPTEDGKMCSFPFFYFGREYSACVRRDHNRSWCATDLNEERSYQGVWSYCSELCPTTTKDNTTPRPSPGFFNSVTEPLYFERYQEGRTIYAKMEAEKQAKEIRDIHDPPPADNHYGYVKHTDERTKTLKWCHKDRRSDCLETYGLENIDPYDFVALLKASKRDDLSDLRDAFTPDSDEINIFGQKPQEFITSCTFDKANCSFRDFYVWQSDTYGNCFTFNSPNLYVADGEGGFVRDDYVRHTTKSGYQNGLRLTLNLDVKNYVSLLSPDLGVRVVIHPPKQTPIPEEEGFSIAPGFLTSIGIRMKKISRIGPPHGICQDRKWGSYPREYSQTSCRMLCVEQMIQRECQCSNSINDLLLALQTDLPRCNPTNLTQDLCRQLQIKKSTTDKKLCHCPPACEDVIYTPLISTNQVNTNFFNIVKNVKGIYVGDDVCSQSQNSTARLHVYLETLQQESIREAPAKTLVSLVADIGGHLGLFIGMSIATMLEVLEFFFDVFLLSGGCANCCRRRQMLSRAPSRARSFRAPVYAGHTPQDYEQGRQPQVPLFQKREDQPLIPTKAPIEYSSYDPKPSPVWDKILLH